MNRNGEILLSNSLAGLSLIDQRSTVRDTKSKIHITSAKINDIETNIAYYATARTFSLTVTQSGNIGTVISVRKEYVNVENLDQTEQEEPVYNIKECFGLSGVSEHGAAARYLAQHLNFDSELILSIHLQDYSASVLNAIIQIVNDDMQTHC